MCLSYHFNIRRRELCSVYCSSTGSSTAFLGEANTDGCREWRMRFMAYMRNGPSWRRNFSVKLAIAISLRCPSFYDEKGRETKVDDCEFIARVTEFLDWRMFFLGNLGFLQQFWTHTHTQMVSHWDPTYFHVNPADSCRQYPKSRACLEMSKEGMTIIFAEVHQLTCRLVFHGWQIVGNRKSGCIEHRKGYFGELLWNK